AIERKLLRHVTDIAANHLGAGRHVEAAYRRASAGWSHEAAEDANRGGFACAVRAQEAEDLALAHLERHVIDGREVAELLHQVVGFHRPCLHLASVFWISAMNTSSSDGAIGRNTAGPKSRLLNLLWSDSTDVLDGERNRCSLAPKGSTLTTPSIFCSASLAARCCGVCTS